MKVTIITCDICNRGNNDGIVVDEYFVEPSIGQEGYLIDQEEIDFCKECLKKYIEKHPQVNVFYSPSGVLVQ